MLVVAFFDHGRRSFGEWYMQMQILLTKVRPWAFFAIQRLQRPVFLWFPAQDNSRPSVGRMCVRFCAESFITSASATILPLAVLWRTNRSPADWMVGTYMVLRTAKKLLLDAPMP